jgi:hypothetical protein
VTGGSVRSIRWTETTVVAVMMLLVAFRVSGCLGDDLCTFAPGALHLAVFVFLGGPALVAAVWFVPVGVPMGAGVRMGTLLVCAGIVALIIGAIMLPGGGPAAAIVPSLGPAFVAAGAMIAVSR